MRCCARKIRCCPRFRRGWQRHRRQHRRPRLQNHFQHDARRHQRHRRVPGPAHSAARSPAHGHRRTAPRRGTRRRPDGRPGGRPNGRPDGRCGRRKCDRLRPRHAPSPDRAKRLGRRARRRRRWTYPCGTACRRRLDRAWHATTTRSGGHFSAFAAAPERGRSEDPGSSSARFAPAARLAVDAAPALGWGEVRADSAVDWAGLAPLFRSARASLSRPSIRRRSSKSVATLVSASPLKLLSRFDALPPDIASR